MTDHNDTFPFGAGFEKAGEAQWRALAVKALRGADFETLVSRTADGIGIQPLTHVPAGGLAAAPPLRRQTGRWNVLARIDHPDADAANQQAKSDLAGGADGLQLVFKHSAGACGFGLDDTSGKSIAKVLGDMDSATIHFLLDLPPQATQSADTLASVIRDSGLNPVSARVDFGLNPLSFSWAANGSASNMSSAVGHAVEQSCTLAANGFTGPFLSADARPVHAAGGSELQELAYLLGAATLYLRACETAGLSLEQAQGFTGFRMAADADQFLNIAKFRALRRLIARLHEACGLTPKPVSVHGETAWRMMTRIDPWVNVLRSTVATFSAVTGGADHVSVLPHTQALGLPDSGARRLARNLQLVLREETHLAAAGDPAGGAGGIEALTDALCDKAWALFQDHEQHGGIAHILANGQFGAAISIIRDKRLADIATARAPLTGTSAFPNLDETPAPTTMNTPVGWSNGYANGLRPLRLSEAFEHLRDRATAAAANGTRPQVYLANLGPLASHNARTNFAVNFFAAGGMATIAGDSGASAESIASGAPVRVCKIACLCGSDEYYASQAAALISALKQTGAAQVFIAGRAGSQDTEWRQAGLDGYVFQGCDMIEILSAALNVFE